MKTKILIIEDSSFKSKTTKYLLEDQLKVDISLIDPMDQNDKDWKSKLDVYQPDVVITRPSGSIVELLQKMKKRNINRRNTEITVFVTPKMDAKNSGQVNDLVSRIKEVGRINKAA